MKNLLLKKSNTFQITHVFIMFFKQLISKNAIFTGPDKNWNCIFTTEQILKTLRNWIYITINIYHQKWISEPSRLGQFNVVVVRVTLYPHHKTDGLTLTLASWLIGIFLNYFSNTNMHLSRKRNRGFPGVAESPGSLYCIIAFWNMGQWGGKLQIYQGNFLIKSGLFPSLV